MHLDTGQFAKNCGRFFKLWPVELHVLARGEVPDAAVITAGDFGQFAQLSGRKHAVGNGDTQHRAVTLDVKTVLQAQWAQLIFGEDACVVAVHLVAILRNAFVDDLLVNAVVAIHASLLL